MADLLNRWGEFPIDEPQPWERTVEDSHKTGRRKIIRSVARSDGKLYRSIEEAAFDNDVKASTIRRCCDGKGNQTAAGYRWRWKCT